jgi:uncharacterized cupredoxin-like copper-binding protein
MFHLMTKGRLLAVVPVVVLAIAACSTGGTSPSPAAATASPAAGSPSPAAGSPSQAAASGTTAVEVKLQEWAVTPAPDSVSAGSVTFKVTNAGPDDTHEFVVLKTDLEPGALPTDSTGAVSETGAGITVVDEIEDIAVGASPMLTVTLAAGKYVLLCNIYDETEKEAHYKMGMRIAFTVK